MNIEWLTEQMEGKAAPTPLLAVQAFANTIDVESGSDWLGSTKDTAEWLRGSGVGSSRIQVTPGLIENAKQLRKVIRRLLAANEQDKVDRKDGATLAVLAKLHQVPLTADATGTLELDLSPADSQDELIGQLLGIIFQAQTAGTWPRLKLCENPECAWAFYDNSRNRSGSWCRMGLCGNRLKNRAYRERLRKSAG